MAGAQSFYLHSPGLYGLDIPRRRCPCLHRLCSNEKGNSITVIDSDTLEVKETIRVGQRPRGIMLTKDGKSLLVCASDDDTVQVPDVATNKIVGDLPSGPDPEQLNIDPSGNPVTSPMKTTIWSR